MAKPRHYEGHEFEALRCRFENQTEQLYRLALIDLKMFTGYITLQLGLGAWIATHQTSIDNPIVRAGLLVVDFALAMIASALLYENYKRRTEVVETVKNCNDALGFVGTGVYLENRSLNAHTKFRPWAG